MAKRICVVTGSRAEFGLLKPLLTRLKKDKRFELQLLVTGAHLSEDFGNTVKEIEAEDFTISARVPIPLSDDSGLGSAKGIAVAVSGAATEFQRLKPDLAIVLGDRYEIFGVAAAALTCDLPLAHLCGGDVTAGAYDESLRHAITKLAHLHFVTNSEAAKRVRAMGEVNVYDVGSTGLDNIRETSMLGREQLQSDLGVHLLNDIFLLTFHPVTRGEQGSLEQLEEFLAALRPWVGKASLCFTLPNADTGNKILRSKIEAFTAANKNTHAFVSLGSLRYLSLMKLSRLVAGNSSSGLYEAPFLKVPAVDVGDRQEGRPRATSVVHAAPDRAAIQKAIESALRLDVSSAISPFGDGQSADRIIEILGKSGNFSALLKKRFVDGSKA